MLVCAVWRPRFLSKPSAGQPRRSLPSTACDLCSQMTPKMIVLCWILLCVCEGCVAGGDGGLCSHVFALLLVLRFWISVSAASDTILKLTVTFSLPRLLGFWLDFEPL